MIYNTIQYVVDNGIGTLTFNRPTVANGFNIEMCKEILEVLDKAHNDESVRALLINAEGKVFSAGGDLTEMERAVNDGDTASLFEIVELVAQISMAMKRLPKPVIMSLQGAAAGAAFNMALAADFVVAANNVRFIQAFVNVGLAPDAGGLFLLTRSIGMNRAMHIVMTGEAVSAEKGKELGFVYKVCELEDLQTATRRLVAVCKSSNSQTLYTKPSSLPFSADTASPVITICIARFIPMERVNKNKPPASGARPTFTKA